VVQTAACIDLVSDLLLVDAVRAEITALPTCRRTGQIQAQPFFPVRDKPSTVSQSDETVWFVPAKGA